jgi:hypothetical protein
MDKIPPSRAYVKVKPKRKPKKKNVQGNWRGKEDKFFNSVRKGFINLMKPPK